VLFRSDDDDDDGDAGGSRHANHLVRRCEFRSVSDTSNFASLLVNFESYRKRDTNETE